MSPLGSQLEHDPAQDFNSVLETGQPGLRIQRLLDSIVDECTENEPRRSPQIGDNLPRLQVLADFDSVTTARAALEVER